MKIDEQQISELCSTIWALSVELDYASKEDKEKCYLQTLLKGSFSLLGVKIPSCSLKLSACNIQIFFKIFDNLLKKYNSQKFKSGSDEERRFIQEVTSELDFQRVFSYLYETIRGLLIYAKEGDFDKLFIDENLIPSLAQVILKIYCEHSDLVLKLTSKVVNKKHITNDDQIYDLMNYVIGTIKCFTQTSKDVQRATVQNQMIAVLSKALYTTFTFGSN